MTNSVTRSDINDNRIPSSHFCLLADFRNEKELKTAYAKTKMFTKRKGESGQVDNIIESGSDKLKRDNKQQLYFETTFEINSTRVTKHVLDKSEFAGGVPLP